MLKKIKRWLIIAAIAVAVFIPTYIAIISYNVINSMPPPVDADAYGISISRADGEKLNIAEADLKNIKKIFLEMRRDAAASADSGYTEGALYRVTLTGAEPGDYDFYFFPDARGYMLDGDELYSLEKGDVERFLATDYSAAVFKNSEMPLLLSGGEGEILPSRAEWKYSAYRGKTVNAAVPIQTTMVTYRHSGKLDLSFSEAPSSCDITVKRSDGRVLYEGNFNGYVSKDFDETHTLEYEIVAEWSGNGYSGSATYRFYSTIGEPAEFEIYYGKYLGEYIEFVEIIGSNIGFTEGVSVTVTPSTGSDPVFYVDGAYVRAVIPFGNDAKEDKYTITATYGDLYGNLTREFTFDYVKRDLKDSEHTFPNLDAATRENYRKQYINAIEEVCRENSETIYMSGSFLDPETASVYEGCTLRVGFGRTRGVEGSDVGYVSDGVYYKMTGNIYALNGGRVVRVGENDWLGKYVVIDHGLGLKTWYCNLLSTSVDEGDTISKDKLEDTPIGMAGNSGYTSDYGFYLMTTVDGVPISPYALFEGGIRKTDSSDAVG